MSGISWRSRPDRSPAPGDVAQTTFDALWQKAADDQGKIYNSLTLDQRLDARKRIIYILSCRGPEGLVNFGPAAPERCGARSSANMFRQTRRPHANAGIPIPGGPGCTAVRMRIVSRRALRPAMPNRR